VCKKSGETLDHLLLHGDVVRELWIMIFQMFGLEWVMPRWVVDLLACLKSKVGRNDINIGWNAIPSFLMWCIWREKNARSFDVRERTSSDIRTCFLKFLFGWISAATFLHAFSYADFCSLFSRS